jgi:SAM-dependent methyltransferase
MKGPFPCSTYRLRRLHPERVLHWHEYAEAWLHPPLGVFLDYGCGDCTFLQSVQEECRQAWGVDVDTERFPAAEALGRARVQGIDPRAPLPFADDTFDTITILDVIEHVADDDAVLRELTRVLKPGGRLLLTTPHRGLLTFLDPGNVKFAAPRLHRFVHVYVLRRPDYYEARFGRTRRAGRQMVGDFTLDQEPWHRHYSYEQIRKRAPQELETVAWAAFFPGMRTLWCAAILLKIATRGRLAHDTHAAFTWLERPLSRVCTRLGDQLVVLFRKRAGAAPPHVPVTPVVQTGR